MIINFSDDVYASVEAGQELQDPTELSGFLSQSIIVSGRDTSQSTARGTGDDSEEV